MIVEMAKIRIAGPRSLLSHVIGLLQDVGAVHIESQPQGLPGIRPDLPLIRRHTLEPRAIQIREALEAALEKTRRLLLLLPPSPAKRGQRRGDTALLADDEQALERLSSELDSVTVQADALAAERKTLEDDLSLFRRYDKVLGVLAPLIAVIGESRELACTGVVIQARERGVAPLLEQALSRLTGGRSEVLYREVDRETLAGLLVFPAEKAAEAKALLWEQNIGELRLPASVADKPVGEALEIIMRELEELPRKIRKLDDALAALSERCRARVEEIHHLLENRIAQILASDTVFETDLAFLLYGWIPETDLPRLAEALSAAFGRIVVLETLPIERSEAENVPVALHNRPFIRPFEIFTRVLPLPRYGTIDPTPLVAFFFPLFYGIIIGDVGYGLVLLGIAAAARRRYGTVPLIADAAAVLSFAALSAVFWGIAYGELFGDLGGRLGLRPLLLHRMKDFPAMIVLAIGIGAAHVLLGIVLGIRTAHRRGRPRETIARSAGLVMVLAAVAMGAAAAGQVPRIAALIGLAVFLGSIAVMILSGGPGAVMELHNLVNILSYLRIMGIGVASVALAYAANRLGYLVRPAPVGVLVGAVLHAVNLAFCILSPAIQTLRLHYVEFFENFFCGGGRGYKPFKVTA